MISCLFAHPCSWQMYRYFMTVNCMNVKPHFKSLADAVVVLVSSMAFVCCCAWKLLVMLLCDWMSSDPDDTSTNQACFVNQLTVAGLSPANSNIAAQWFDMNSPHPHHRVMPIDQINNDTVVLVRLEFVYFERLFPESGALDRHQKYCTVKCGHLYSLNIYRMSLLGFSTPYMLTFYIPLVKMQFSERRSDESTRKMIVALYVVCHPFS